MMNASHPSPAAVTAAIAPAIAADLGQRPGLAPETPTPGQERAAIRVAWARHLDEVRQAQRLRFRVFATEMGARLSTTLAGQDVDRLDGYCEHLLVCAAQSQQVIGTCRVLTPGQARRIGGIYSD